MLYGLKRILFVAIIGLGLCGGNADGMVAAPPPPPPVAQPVLDLPLGANGTPGLHMTAGGINPVLISKTINGVPNKSCLHIIVPGTPAAANGINARNFDGNIYFPRNGVQPTTPEAVEYSCANIDNRENSPITEWYMMIFGVIPINHAAIAAVAVGGVPPAPIYVQAGWSAPAVGGAINAQQIISFDASVDNTMVNDPNIHGAQISKRALFEREFRKIASTSVGRVLLYRILIEIRRHNPGGNVGCQETNCDCSNTERDERNKSRSIRIKYGQTFCFSSDENPSIEFCNMLGILTVVGKSSKQGFTYVVPVKDSLDISIVHEMIHWFHELRNVKRKQEEYDNYDPSRGTINPKNFTNYYIGQYYWHNLNYHLRGYNAWNRHEISELPWSSDNYIRFEEIRTILGLHCDAIESYYLQGDDLSENLYRICIGFSLRFGYGCQGFFEDRKVINRVINTCFTSYIYYMGGNNHIERYQNRWVGQEDPNAPKVEFDYRNDTNASSGLGYMKCINDFHFHIQQ